ncbi:hypothetical protein PQX77_004720 [Marasmius sp. AFHP31]|nr:hypothetical protein PQX77_004720 [Marasmius sp. AFHP31]
MRSDQTFIALSVLVSLVSAGTQLESNNIGFPNKGTRGCIAATKTAGAPLVIHDCFTGDASNYNWVVGDLFPVDPTPQQIKLFGSDLCIDVKDGANADGTKLQVWTCANGNGNQLWTRLNYIGIWQWAGTNKCIDLSNGVTDDGNQLQLWTCDPNNSNPNQQFPDRFVPDTQTVPITLEGGPDLTLCLAATENADGARVSLAPCNNLASIFPTGNLTWVAPRANLAGVLSTFGGTKCIDLTGGDLSNGTPLQLWSCDASNPNQIWKVQSLIPKGNSRVDRAGNKCIDIRNGNYAPGADIQIWDCDLSGSNINQRWIARQ